MFKELFLVFVTQKADYNRIRDPLISYEPSHVRGLIDHRLIFMSRLPTLSIDEDFPQMTMCAFREQMRTEMRSQMFVGLYVDTMSTYNSC